MALPQMPHGRVRSARYQVDAWGGRRKQLVPSLAARRWGIDFTDPNERYGPYSKWDQLRYQSRAREGGRL